MKRRIVPLLTFTVALVLVSSIAYAAKKKAPAKPEERPQDPTHEEEALRTELLAATEGRETPGRGAGEAGIKKKVVRATGNEAGGEAAKPSGR